MVGILSSLERRWAGLDYPFLIFESKEVNFHEIATAQTADLSMIQKGDVVALIGDFEPTSICTLLRLIDLEVILVPLTRDTVSDHQYFFESCGVDVVIEGTSIERIRDCHFEHDYLNTLRDQGNSGLVLFSTGTTGRPKAILHNFELFLKRFETPRPTLRTLNFLLFDHIGGINTLLHTLYNKGTIVSTADRSIESVLSKCRKHEIELLPTTPTFLRMMVLGGCTQSDVPSTLKFMTYGTERMDQATLDRLCSLFPDVDFRQTFGMSELGIVRVKSESRNSLFMQIGGEGIETRVEDGVLFIKSENRMLGYLNAPSPFDADGWYNTKDIVESKGNMIKVVGRDNEVINVGGLKFMASEVELIALENADIEQVKVNPKTNPITGQHVEVTVQLRADSAATKRSLGQYFADKLPKHMQPQRIVIGDVKIGHRFKKL